MFHLVFRALSHSLGNFISTAERVRLPDDCTIGYIIEGLLEVKLLHSPLFHSHLENLQRLQGESVLQQVGLSLMSCSCNYTSIGSESLHTLSTHSLAKKDVCRLAQGCVPPSSFTWVKSILSPSQRVPELSPPLGTPSAALSLPVVFSSRQALTFHESQKEQV